MFLWQSLHYRYQHLNTLLAVRCCTYPHYRWYHHQCFLSKICWILGKLEIFSYPACLRAGMLFRMAAFPAHISSYVVWSRPQTSVSRRDPPILSILILHSLMDLVTAAQLSFPVVCADASLLSNCPAHLTVLLCCNAFASLDQKSPVASSHFHSSISSISSAKESHKNEIGSAIVPGNSVCLNTANNLWQFLNSREGEQCASSK